jgi:S1-C subfamily serine protease
MACTIAAVCTIVHGVRSTAAPETPAANAGSGASGRVALRERMLRSIVGIRVSREEPKLSSRAVQGEGGRVEQGGVGSGIVVGADGLILTCAHVLGTQTRAWVTLPDGRTPAATLVARIPRRISLCCRWPA